MRTSADASSLDVVDTSIVRFIRARLELTHQERAICVIAGPWGIGKTTAVESFIDRNPGNCVAVKVEQGTMSRGASPLFILQQIIEALRPRLRRTPRGKLSTGYWPLRQLAYRYLAEWREQRQPNCAGMPRLSIVFDEAQYLSRDAIEMLRFWNDEDRTVAPFPVGLIFIGNSEFILDEAKGQSVLSGAVRSRALFLETLSYDEVSDDDIVKFFKTLGQYDDSALALLLDYFRRPRIRRDFRTMNRLHRAVRRRDPEGTITAAVARAILFDDV